MLFGYTLRLHRNTEPDVTMEAEIVAVYYGMSVNRTLEILRYVRTVAARIAVLS